jgi:hypothetical protein
MYPLLQLLDIERRWVQILVQNLSMLYNNPMVGDQPTNPPGGFPDSVGDTTMATRTKKEAVEAVRAAIEAVQTEAHDTATPLDTPKGVLALARSVEYRVTLQKTTTATGNKSLDNGDSVALLLRGADLETVYQIGARELGVSVAELKTKYAHLNPGQQRMNVGNRVRGAIKKREARQQQAA